MTHPESSDFVSPSAIEDSITAMVATILSTKKHCDRPCAFMIVWESLDGNLHVRTFPDLRSVQDGMVANLWRNPPV